MLQHPKHPVKLSTHRAKKIVEFNFVDCRRKYFRQSRTNARLFGDKVERVERRRCCPQHIPVFPIQYATFTELSLTTRGVSYSLPCKMTALFGPLKNGFWGQKREDLTPGQIDPKGTHPPPKHVFGCTERKSTLLRVSCGRIEGTKKKKIKKSTRGCNFTHMPNPTPIFDGHHILHVLSDCGRNHTCQISSESVQGFRSPRWPKMTISH